MITSNPKFLSRVHSCKILAVFLWMLLNFSLPQGSALPYMTSDVKEVSGKFFDYIIVGGGTAGCPLAATLSEKFTVLLVERGGSPYGDPLVMEKRNYGLSLLQTDEYTSVAQSFISKDGVGNLRGRVLGGSSAINGGFYSRAREDFIKKAGWDKELVKEAYGWVESRVVFSPMLTPLQLVFEFGLLEAGILPYNGFSLEHIEGTKVGGTVFDEFGKRHTSADLLEAGNPKNIVVLLNTTVKNIIFHTTGKGNKTRARGIRFIRSDGSSNKVHEAYLKQPKNSSKWGDVIVSAGALGSPQLLLLSGIGSPEHLKKLDIPVKIDLHDVGQRMQDNPSIAVLVDNMPTKRELEPPLVVGIADDYKFIIEGGVLPISFNATRIPIAAKIAFPASKGKLELESRDPRKNPSVKFNYLAEEKDLEECVKMVQLLEKVARSESVSMFVGNKPNSKLMSSDDQRRKLCKNSVRTYYHYHGGCVLGTVVDEDYRVRGVKRLRVIDGSTFEESPGTNPMATLMMLGRYQGVKMLKESKWGDVILSAGALGSPQLLLLSGIGSPKHLKQFDIPVKVALQGVGQRMQDNPSIAILVNNEPSRREPEPPLVVGIADDYKFIVQSFVSPISFNSSTISLAAKIAFPASKGKLGLESRDPRQNPSVKFNYLAEKKDLEECVEMVQLIERVARSKSVSTFPGIKPEENFTTSAEQRRKICKNNVRSYFHFHGGCVLGTVVDEDYRVHGVKGLRVIDGSTFEESPGTNPMATLMMLGRYQGIKMLKERTLASIPFTIIHP